MVCHSFFQLVVLVTLFLQVRCSPFALQKRGTCATEDPGADFLHEVARLQSDEANPAGSQAREAPIEIETWFHIISSKSESTQVTDDMINSQLSILQQSYADSGISYQLQGVTRHVNDKWASNADDTAMKTALRKGSYRTLNVYFQTNLKASPGQAGRALGYRGAVTNNDLASSVLGFCTLPDPSVNASSPASHYVKDGCNILANTMPGGSLDLYNRGGTAIHEIGHWNGLLHTFQGESCSADNAGDHISDTPQQSTPTDGCPEQKDSCPDSLGWTRSTTSWTIHLMYAMSASRPDKESACGVFGCLCVKGNSGKVTSNKSNASSLWSPFAAICTPGRPQGQNQTSQLS